MKEKLLKSKRKKSQGMSVMVRLLLFGMAAGSFSWLLQRAEATASGDMIQISRLSVVAMEDGICASCFYQNFDSDTCTVQLYLEKQSGMETIPVVYRNLSGTGEEGQQIETEICREGTGIYRAVLLTRAEGETTVVRFRDSGWYEAVDLGDHYEVRPYLPGNEGNTTSKRELVEEEPEKSIGSVCEHKPVRELYEPATSQRDAVFCESCESCGQVLAYGEIPNTAYVSFLNQAASIIYGAQQGEQVVISTDRWMSFDERVLDAVSKREDVSVLIRYRDQGEEHQVLLPAGTDAGRLGDENGFCGFRYLNQIFGSFERKK